MRKAVSAIVWMVLATSLAGCAFVNVPLVPPPQPLEEQVLEGKGRKKILMLDISGTISELEKSGGLLGRATPSMVSMIRESLQKAEQDKDLAGVILRINSPGGTVTASDIIHHDIGVFRQRTHLPVKACIMSTGASGGYYIAAAADEIVAHPTAIVGSIGVIMMKFNVEGLMGKIGIEEQTVKSGDKKDIMSPFRRATPEEVRLGQEIIDQLYGRFLEVIMARPGNKLSRDELVKLADGRIYTARQALEARLIDRTGYLDDVIADLKTTIGDQDARVVSYYRPGNYKGSIYAGSEAKEGLAEVFGGGVDLLSNSRFMYLWRP
ncbi:signal peptide peptidase SppA [Geobacter sp. SVR]|uniref:signal peptide peptidase SppA n=1 Tax=Geobacter sp. SVR TaxID=2495594 RepID=UPI00143F02D0|nr:signal peptide peptidase SppA [Geobacter sp. SVR]BCS52494.1 signal peptide peptidase SppA [Geobacter sp. SVR]GCF84069.1 signal peptide peptidase SppA [Geobacter sp. SVR]